MQSANTNNVHSFMGKDQRRHPRYDVQIPASIRLKDGKNYNGITNNISSNGAFFAYDNFGRIKKETHCTLTLFIEGKLYSEEITIDCVFKPHHKGGVGLEFKTMTTNDFINFIFMLSKKLPDPNKFISEISTDPGIELSDDI